MISLLGQSGHPGPGGWVWGQHCAPTPADKTRRNLSWTISSDAVKLGPRPPARGEIVVRRQLNKHWRVGGRRLPPGADGLRRRWRLGFDFNKSVGTVRAFGAFFFKFLPLWSRNWETHGWINIQKKIKHFSNWLKCKKKRRTPANLKDCFKQIFLQHIFKSLTFQLPKEP